MNFFLAKNSPPLIPFSGSATDSIHDWEFRNLVSGQRDKKEGKRLSGRKRKLMREIIREKVNESKKKERKWNEIMEEWESWWDNRWEKMGEKVI